jgi:hypothetical protein
MHIHFNGSKLQLEIACSVHIFVAINTLLQELHVILVGGMYVECIWQLDFKSVCKFS